MSDVRSIIPRRIHFKHSTQRCYRRPPALPTESIQSSKDSRIPEYEVSSNVRSDEQRDSADTSGELSDRTGRCGHTGVFDTRLDGACVLFDFDDDDDGSAIISDGHMVQTYIGRCPENFQRRSIRRQLTFRPACESSPRRKSGTDDRGSSSMQPDDLHEHIVELGSGVGRLSTCLA